jgi:uncharacterized glyoxalase superfamily protein PhnB
MSEPEIPKTVWPCLTYADARAAATFLVDVLGFELRCAYPPEGESVAHAEARWPEGGGVMFGSADREESEFSRQPVGGSSVYVVTDDPHPILARCETAGVRIVKPMTEEDFGSTGFSIADPEGNLWSFGTYRGE